MAGLALIIPISITQAQNVKISELPPATTLSGAEIGPQVQSGATVKVTANQMATLARIGTQPLDSDLTAIAALTTTSVGRDLLTSSDAAAIRSKAGLGTISTQNSSAVTITGGTITGITDLAVADGGTGSSTASGARTNLSAAVLGANSDITSLSGLTTPLTIPQGGIGAATLPTGALKGAGSGAITQAAASDLSNGTTGSATVMLSASPTTTGTLTAAAVTASGAITANAGLNAAAGQVIGFNSDVGFSRAAAGTVNLGNGSAGDSTGILTAAEYNISGNANLTTTAAGAARLGTGTTPGTGGSLSLTGLTAGGAVNFSTSATVTAGTNAQGQGALTTDYNVITTAAASPSGVTLPTATVGRRIVVVNKGANAIAVFPASGGSVDALSANASISVPVAGVMIFNASSTTQWYSTANLTFASSEAVTSFSAGTTGLTPSTATTGAVTLAGSLAVANGGCAGTTAATCRSNISAAASGANSDITSLSTLSTPLTVAQGGSGAGTLTGHISGNGTGAFTASSTIAITDITGVATVVQGGTGQNGYTTGDILYATGATTLSKIADVATGNALISGGVGSLPTYGKIALTTHVSGVLPVANGGTNCSSATITCFNNITGFSAAGTTGTTSTNLVFSAAPAVTGLTTDTVVASSTITASALIPSGSTIPTNGMYLPAGNTLGWSISSAAMMSLNASGLTIGNSTQRTAKLFVGVATDTTPNTISAWDTRHLVVGSTTSGLIFSKNTTGGASGYITSSTPGSSWDPIGLQGSEMDFFIGGSATATAIVSSAGLTAGSGNLKLNKVTLTAPATGSTITVADGKTLTVSNTLTLTATDSSTLAIGAGGTLGTAAYVATGTSGATIPLLNGNNTYSGTMTANAGLNAAAGQVIGFNSDVGFSRSSAASLSLGNGSAGDSTGSMTLTQTNLSGNANITSSVSGTLRVGTGTTAGTGGSLSLTGITASGTVIFSGLGTDAGTTDNSACVRSDTKALVTGTGTLGICLGTSSARYKRDIKPLDIGLAQIMALQPKSFFYKPGYGDGGAREQYGLIAEDVVKVIPKLVGLDADGKPNTADLLGIVPALINSVHELQAQITSLKAELATTKQKVAETTSNVPNALALTLANDNGFDHLCDWRDDTGKCLTAR